jgi:hypothetical protein
MRPIVALLVVMQSHFRVLSFSGPQRKGFGKKVEYFLHLR